MKKLSTLFLAFIFAMTFTAIGLAATPNSAPQADEVMHNTKTQTKKVYHRGHYETRRVWINGKRVTKRVWVTGSGKVVKGTRWTTHKTKRGAKKVYNTIMH